MDEMTPIERCEIVLFAEAESRLPADRHPAMVYLARLAPGSRRTIHGALREITRILTCGERSVETMRWHAIGYQHAAAVRADLAARYSPASANKILAALRGVLREAMRLGLMSPSEHSKASDIASVRGSEAQKGRAVTRAEMRLLFESCARDRRPTGARDAAVIAVLYAGGLRRSELVALDVADFAPGTGALTVRRGKGRKARVVYIRRGAAKALAAWLLVRGEEPGPLFYPINKGGSMMARRLTDGAVLRLLARRARKAGVAAFSPHDLRRTFVGDLLEAGADISTVQQMAGHASVATTQRYDRRGDATRQRAAELLDVPYSRATRRTRNS